MVFVLFALCGSSGRWGTVAASWPEKVTLSSGLYVSSGGSDLPHGRSDGGVSTMTAWPFDPDASEPAPKLVGTVDTV